MEIKPIRTQRDYKAALAEIERVFEAKPGTPDGDRLEVLATLVEAYEERHHPVPPPDPVDAILYFMESRGLSRKEATPSGVKVLVDTSVWSLALRRRTRSQDSTIPDDLTRLIHEYRVTTALRLVS